MDQKPDSQKRPSSQFDENSLSCPVCKDLDEHRNSNCPKQLISRDSSKPRDMDSDKDKTYDCDECCSSLKDSQSLERQQSNCLNMTDTASSVTLDSYETCRDALIQAIFDEKRHFDILRAVRHQVQSSIKRYTDARQRKVSAHKAYVQAVAKNQILGTIVSLKEKQILSNMVSEFFQKHEDAANALEREMTLLFSAVNEAKLRNLAGMLSRKNVHMIFSQAISILNERRLLTISGYQSPEDEQELKEIQGILKERSTLLSRLQDEIADLDSIVSSMMEVDLMEEKSTNSKNGNEGKNATQEILTVNGPQLTRTEADTGIQDEGTSTSEICSGYISDACHQPPDNM